MIIKDELVNLTENITDGDSSVKNKKGQTIIYWYKNIVSEKIQITEKIRNF